MSSTGGEAVPAMHTFRIEITPVSAGADVTETTQRIEPTPGELPTRGAGPVAIDGGAAPQRLVGDADVGLDVGSAGEPVDAGPFAGHGMAEGADLEPPSAEASGAAVDAGAARQLWQGGAQ